MDLQKIDPSDPFFLEAMHLYIASFPPVERKPEDIIVSLLQGGHYQLYVAIDNGSLVGLSALYLFEDLRMASLDYLAVAPFKQDLGLGTLIFNHALRQAARQIPHFLGLVMEVQREDLALEPKEQRIREARLRFYRRLGAKVITRSYFLPPQSGTKPEEMYLLILPAVHPILLDKDQMLNIIWALHFRVYGYMRKDLLELTAKGLPGRLEL